MSDEKKPENNVIDVTELAGRFKSRVELQRYSEKLFSSFKSAVEKLQKLETENAHLKELLKAAIPSIGDGKFEVSSEQAIAEIQLKKLQEIASSRELTLDEVKRFDLLVKNLYLSTGKPTSVLKTKGRRLPDDISEAELVELAKKSDKDE